MPEVQFGAKLAEGALDPPRDVALGPACEAFLRKPLEHPVGERARAADRLDLTGVLDRAEGFDEAAGRHDVHAAGAQRLPLHDRQRRRLDADAPPRQELRELADDVSPGLRERDSFDHLCPPGVPRVGVEGRLAARLDDERRVRAVETDEIADVDPGRHEERLLKARGEPLEPRHDVRSLESSASASR